MSMDEHDREKLAFCQHIAKLTQERDDYKVALRQSMDLCQMDRDTIVRLEQERDDYKVALRQSMDLCQMDRDTIVRLEQERGALRAELADAKKLAMDLICENQGLKHKIDIMNKEQGRFIAVVEAAKLIKMFDYSDNDDDLVWTLDNITEKLLPLTKDTGE